MKKSGGSNPAEDKINERRYAGLKNKKGIIILAAVNAFLLILIGLCLWRCGVFTNTLRSQQAAELWKGSSEERFAQISCFMPVGQEVELNTVRSFRSSIESSLNDAGIESVEGKQYWADAFSATTKLTVTGAKESAEVTAVGVGGDFFLFHPYELLSGGYLTPDDVMQDRVILDYELAWKLFGSADLAGMSVTIDEKPYYVAGVIRRETDKFSEKALPEEPLMFLSYSELPTEEGEAGISCYEFVMADPITDFAKNLATESFAGGKSVVVQNSTRYSFGNIFGFFKDFGLSSISDNGVIYPYWENAARISEVYVARQYVFVALLGIIPFICLVWLVVLLIIFLIKKLKQGWAYTREAWSDRYARIENLKDKRAARKARRGEPKEKKSRKAKTRKSRVQEEQEIESPPEREPEFDKSALAMDVESILREINEEKK